MELEIIHLCPDFLFAMTRWVLSVIESVSPAPYREQIEAVWQRSCSERPWWLKWPCCREQVGELTLGVGWLSRVWERLWERVQGEEEGLSSWIRQRGDKKNFETSQIRFPFDKYSCNRNPRPPPPRECKKTKILKKKNRFKSGFFKIRFFSKTNVYYYESDQDRDDIT